MKLTDIKAFALRYKWWLVAAAVLLVAIVVLIALKRRKAGGDRFDRDQYKTITAQQREKLETLHVAIKQRGYALVDAIQKMGFEAEITSAYRSFQHQQRLRDQLGSMAATPGTSPHNYGLALDIVLWKNGRKYGNYNASKSEWESTGVPAFARQHGWTWGGDFKTHPFDPVHFDLKKNLGVSTSDLFEKGKKIYGSPEKIIGNKISI
jgi:hypothetical protein